MDRTVVRSTIGANIRRKRKALGLTLEYVAGRLQVSYQQVQKYESGANSITSEKLVEIAGILGCRLEELANPMDHPYELDLEMLVYHFRRIRSARLRELAVEMIASISG